MHSHWWKLLVASAVVCTSTHAQVGETEGPASNANQDRTTDGNAEVPSAQPSARVEVRREPVYDHRPGRSSEIVSWIIIYSDGTRKTVEVNGNRPTVPTEDLTRPQRQNTRPPPSPDEVKSKVRQYLSQAHRLTQMAEREEKQIQTLNADRDQLNRVIRDQEKQLQNLEAGLFRIGAQIPYSLPKKKSVPPLFTCPRGEPFETCKHYDEKAESIRARTEAIDHNAAIDARMRVVDSLERQQSDLRRQRTQLESQLSGRKKQADALRTKQIVCQQRKAEWMGELNAMKRVMVPVMQSASRGRDSSSN